METPHDTTHSKPSRPASVGTCPDCRSAVGPECTYCPKCGRRLAAAAPGLPPKGPSQTVAEHGGAGKANHAAPRGAVTTHVGPGHEASPKPLQEPSETATQTVTSGEPGRCACGFQPGDGRYCSQCGRPLTDDSEPTYRVVCRGPTGARRAVAFAGPELIIGKAGHCDLAVSGDELLSREHARLTLKGNRIVLEDLVSSNGTYVRVRQPFLLQDGDEIVAGATVIRIERIASGS